MLILNSIQDLHPSETYAEKNWNPMKRFQVIIRTPTADGRTDGRTGWIQYTPQLRYEGHENIDCGRKKYHDIPLGALGGNAQEGGAWIAIYSAG